MVPRLNINAIAIDTPDWTCKVQIVDMSRDRLSSERKIRFQNLILEDEQEQQIRGTIYGEDIDFYVDKLTLFETYIISTARVKLSLPSYGRMIHKFYWVFDKETVFEHIKGDNELERPLLPPTKGNQFLLTLWDDFGEIEGTELEGQMGKDLSLQTRFNSTIRINPTYPQALRLISWAKANKDVLSANMLANFVGSSTFVAGNPVHGQVLSIADITSGASVGVFCVEAEMAISNDLQKFCILECSGCKQKKGTKEKKQFDCAKCERKTSVVPRCAFQLDLIDATGSTIAFISGDPAEKLLSMKANEIFDTTCVKTQLLRVDQTKEMLAKKLFQIQVRKSCWTNSNITQSSLTVFSYTEKEDIFPPLTAQRNTTKPKSVDPSEVQVMPGIVKSESSSNGTSIEPLTPLKKL